MATEIITICNHGYRDFTWNLSLTCQKQNIPLTIYTTDQDATRFLLNQGISSKRLPGSGQGQTKNLSQIFTSGFSTMCKAKLDMICQRIKDSTADYLVYMDGDIVVLKNFIDDIKSKLNETPLLFQCDEKDLSGCLAKPCPNACTGFIAMNLMNHRQELLAIFSVENELWKRVNGLDQDFVNHRLKDSKISWNTLPRHLYPNGVYFARNAFDKENAFIIHFNYTIGQQKRGRMIKSGYWSLPIQFAS
jgi:hypothetical protein